MSLSILAFLGITFLLVYLCGKKERNIEESINWADEMFRQSRIDEIENRIKAESDYAQEQYNDKMQNQCDKYVDAYDDYDNY